MTTSQHRPTAGSRFGFTLGPARSLALGLLAGALVLPMTARAGEGGDGSRQPSENELAGARYQGRAIAEAARKLHG